MNYLSICIILVGLLGICAMQQGLQGERQLSPYDFGFRKARNGEERYKVLYATHIAAIERGVSVNYRGIKTINLSIPADAKAIPLPSSCDFKGVVFNVSNNSKNICLFTISSKITTTVIIEKKDIDIGDFSSIQGLNPRNLLRLLQFL